MGLWLAFSFLVLFACALLPIIGTSVPMLSDYANHLARVHILQQDGMSAALNQFYSIEWAPLPNLGMDIVAPVLAQEFGIYKAGRIFLAITFLLLAASTFALHYALHHRLSPWPLTVMLLLYNQIFLYGLLNFLFGLGLAIGGIAAWVIFAERPRIWHVPGLAILATLTWLSHLSAFGIFALVTGTLLVCQWSDVPLRVRRVGLYIASLTIPVLLTLAATKTTSLPNPDPAELAILIAYYITKPLLVFMTFSAAGNYIDTLLSIVIALVLILGFRRQYVAISPKMKWPLSVLVIAFLACPPVLMGSALADCRILVAAQFLFIACADICPTAPPRLVRCAGTVLASVFSMYVLAISERWQDADQVAKAALTAFRQVADGSRLYPAIRKEGDGESFQANYEDFLPTLAVISRSAFVPSLYTLPGAQPVVMTSKYQRLRAGTPQPRIPAGQEPNWPFVLANYDFIWISTREHYTSLPIQNLQVLYSHPRFHLYKIVFR